MYLAAQHQGLVTARITPDNEIIVLGNTPTWDDPEAVTQFDNQLFVADGTAGLLIYDITDASSPQWLAHIDTPGMALDVEAIPQRTFVLDSYMGLVVIDNHRETGQMVLVR